MKTRLLELTALVLTTSAIAPEARATELGNFQLALPTIAATPLAQSESEAASPDQATAQPAVDPSAPAVTGAHTHDGFYLRLSLGTGYALDSGKASAGSRVDVYGLTVPFEFWAGGTVARGLVVGLGLSISPLSSPKSDPVLITSGKGISAQYTRLGPFVDYYFDPKQGLHVMGSLNMGGMLVKDAASNKTLGNSKGLAVNAGLGYDLWFANQWSVGVIGQFGYTLAWSEDETHHVITPAILANVTFH